MLATAAELFAILAPVLTGAGIGYGWARLGQPYDTKIVTQLLTLVTTPCLVFSRLAVVDINGGLVWDIMLAACLAIACFAALGYVAAKLSGLDVASAVPPVMFPNCGNMGLALSLFAFGSDGLALGIGFFVVSATAQFVLSPSMASGRFSLAQVIRAPLIYATILAIVVLTFDLRVPVWILNTTRLLGDVSIPMMLITLGVSLAGLSISHMKGSAIVALTRLVVGLAVGLGLIWLFNFQGMAAGIVLLMCSMPAAVFNYLFAEKYGADAKMVAGAVMLSTLLSFLSLPVLLYFVLQLAG